MKLRYLAILCLASVCLGQNLARMLSGVNNQTGAIYTFVAQDVTKVVNFNKADPIAATLPSSANQGFGKGSIFLVVNSGAGTVTITCSGCTISGQPTYLVFTGQSVELYGDGANYIAASGSALSGNSFSSITVQNQGSFGTNGLSGQQAWFFLSDINNGAFYYDGTNTYDQLSDVFHTPFWCDVNGSCQQFLLVNPLPTGVTPSAGQVPAYTSNGFALGGVISTGNTVRLTADVSGIVATTPGTAFLTFPALAPSTDYSFTCQILYSQATAFVLDGFSIQAATNAATRWDAWGTMYISNPSSTNLTGSQNSALNVTTTTATPVVSATPAATGTVYQAILNGSIRVGAAAPTMNVAAFTGNAADAVTIKAGTFCSIAP